MLRPSIFHSSYQVDAKDWDTLLQSVAILAMLSTIMMTVPVAFVQNYSA